MRTMTGSFMNAEWSQPPKPTIMVYAAFAIGQRATVGGVGANSWKARPIACGAAGAKQRPIESDAVPMRSLKCEGCGRDHPRKQQSHASIRLWPNLGPREYELLVDQSDPDQHSTEADH